MEVIKDIGNYYELKENSWSGALDTLEDIEKADKEEELVQFLEDFFADRTPTETEVNDLLWHDREYIYENVGLNSNGELPTVFDELEEDYTIIETDIANMRESCLFTEDILDNLLNMVNHSSNGHIIVLPEELSNEKLTEEQAEWIRDNL